MLFVDSTVVHLECSYRERCEPFGIEPCKQGQVCVVSACELPDGG